MRSGVVRQKLSEPGLCLKETRGRIVQDFSGNVPGVSFLRGNQRSSCRSCLNTDPVRQKEVGLLLFLEEYRALRLVERIGVLRFRGSCPSRQWWNFCRKRRNRSTVICLKIDAERSLKRYEDSKGWDLSNRLFHLMSAFKYKNWSSSIFQPRRRMIGVVLISSPKFLSRDLLGHCLRRRRKHIDIFGADTLRMNDRCLRHSKSQLHRCWIEAAAAAKILEFFEDQSYFCNTPDWSWLFVERKWLWIMSLPLVGPR